MTTTRNATRPRGEHTDREETWLAIQASIEDGDDPRFTFDDVRQQCDDVKDHTIEKVIQTCRQSGIIETVERTRTAIYAQTMEVSGFPSCVSTRVLAWRQQVWNTLRIQRITTVPAIQATLHEVDPAEDTVYRYLRRLETAGYVIRAGRNGPDGQVMSHLRWRLVRDTGPTAPTRAQLNEEISEQTDEAAD